MASRSSKMPIRFFILKYSGAAAKRARSKSAASRLRVSEVDRNTAASSAENVPMAPTHAPQSGTPQPAWQTARRISHLASAMAQTTKNAHPKNSIAAIPAGLSRIKNSFRIHHRSARRENQLPHQRCHPHNRAMQQVDNLTLRILDVQSSTA